jgi:hypothetical protein
MGTWELQHRQGLSHLLPSLGLEHPPQEQQQAQLPLPVCSRGRELPGLSWRHLQLQQGQVQMPLLLTPAGNSRRVDCQGREGRVVQHRGQVLETHPHQPCLMQGHQCPSL